jgi:hypothetical protein
MESKNIENLQIEPEEVHFNIVAGQPDASEFKCLKELTFDNKKLAANRKRIAKDKLKSLGEGFLKAIGILLAGGFGFLFLTEANISGGFRGIVWIATLSTPVIAVACIVVGVIPLFKSGKMDAPATAFSGWASAILGGDYFEKNENRKIEKRIDILYGLTPVNIVMDKVRQYIDMLRQTLANAMNEITDKILKEYGLTPAFTKIEQKIEAVETLYPGIEKIEATITVTDCIKHEIDTNNSKFFYTAIIKLHIIQYLIETANGLWYPYDLTPAYKANADMELIAVEKNEDVALEEKQLMEDVNINATDKDTAIAGELRFDKNMEDYMAIADELYFDRNIKS